MATKLATIVADFTTSLATAMAVGATTATLQSATDDDGVALPAGVYFFALDGNNAQKEHIVATLSGSSLTNISSISRQGVQTSGVVRSHRVGSTVTLTDFAHLKYINDLLKGATTLDSTAPLGYDGTATISTANQLATKAYVDGVAIAGGADASTTIKGISKMSVAPASPTSPIAVGDNDGRVPTQGENDALVGSNTTIAVGSGNKFVTQTGLQNKGETYAASTGSSNAYVLTLSPVPTALAAGQEFEFKANFANTGAATLNVNSLGAIAIKKLNGATALASGDIANGQIVKVKYDGTNFQMLSPTGNASTVPTTQAIAAVTPTNDTNENTIFTTSIAANTLGPTGSIKIRIPFLTGSPTTTPSTYTIRLKFGGSTIASTTLEFPNIGGGAAQIAIGFLEAYIFAKGGLTNSQDVFIGLVAGAGGSGGSNVLAVYAGASTSTTSAIDTTSTQTLAITQQKSAAQSSAVYGLGHMTIAVL